MLSSHLFIFSYLFRSGQIAKVEFSSEQHTSMISGIRLNKDLENCMWPRWMYIRSRLPGDPILLTSFKQQETIVGILNNIFWLALHEDSSVLILPDIECFRCVSVLEQIE